MSRITDLAHQFVSAALRPGDCAVDATAGNGHDALFLAEIVGQHGLVHAFDIQEEALRATKRRIGERPQVRLHLRCHSEMARILGDERPSAAMFNLGYLPSGDKSRITRPETTLAALDSALELLRTAGVLTVAAYPAHPGGAEETEAVRAWCAALPSPQFRATRHETLNREVPPPVLFAVEKRE